MIMKRIRRRSKRTCRKYSRSHKSSSKTISRTTVGNRKKRRSFRSKKKSMMFGVMPDPSKTKWVSKKDINIFKRLNLQLKNKKNLLNILKNPFVQNLTHEQIVTLSRFKPSKLLKTLSLIMNGGDFIKATTATGSEEI